MGPFQVTIIGYPSILIMEKRGGIRLRENFWAVEVGMEEKEVQVFYS